MAPKTCHRNLKENLMSMKILIPIDVEEPGTWAGVLPSLRQHVSGNDFKLCVLSVVPELGTIISQAAQAAPFSSSTPAKLKDTALSVASERLKSITDTDEFGDIDRVIRSGSIYSSVLKVAEEKETDLIILMSHMPGLSDYLLGSNAAKIVRHAKCSVYVVRN